MKLLLILVFFISLNGDILTMYREHGIKNIKKQLDLELSKPEYWSRYLKDKDTTFGYIESYTDILVCDKSKSTLSLYTKNSKDKYMKQNTYSAFTGKFKGDKQTEGDLRTPIGIYNLTKKISEVDSFYGPLAFVTSYPNIYDRYRGKNGSGIWIHGLPINQDRDEFTKGCIAIDNTNIKCLDREINIDKTLLIINPTNNKNLIKKEKLVTILSNLYEWRYAWLYNDLKNYLKFYASDFIRFDGMNLKEFERYKSRVFKKSDRKTIVFSDINVIPYPNTDNIYQITFKEFYRSNTFVFRGNKILMVRLKSNNMIEIFTEK
jgi:murein L,D-transpeptidase YafK